MEKNSLAMGRADDGCSMVFLVATGQITELERLHRRGALGDGRDAAVLAAANGQLSVLQFLHRSGYDLGSASRRALRFAAAAGRLEVVRYLRDTGCDMRACHDAAIKAAAAKGELAVLQYLHQQGADLTACRDIAPSLPGSPAGKACADYLAANGVDCDVPRPPGHSQGADIPANDAAVRFAVENGDLSTAAFLKECGADFSRLGDHTLAWVRLHGHESLYDYLTASCGLDGIARQRAAVAAMQGELRAARPVYQPSKLWEFFNDVNMEQLRRGGMESFKRSVNQNYFNFVPRGLLDSQLLALFGWWMTHPTTTPFSLDLIDPDIDPESGRLRPIGKRVFTAARRSPTAFALALKLGWDPGRRIQLAFYRWLIAMLWDYVRAHDQLGLAEKLAEPRLGFPIETFHRGRLISQDLCHSILECNALAPALKEPAPDARPLRLAEIGAGYGRLAYAILRAASCQYLIFDISPGLAVSQWYLSHVFTGKRIFHFRHFERFEDIAAELAGADIAFFTANQIELFPDGYVDLSINISSLHEMRPEQIAHMLAQMHRIASRFVYLKQYREYINPYDGLTIREDCYTRAAGWRDRFRRTDGTDPRFFEALIEKETLAGTASGASIPTARPVPSSPAATSAALPTVSILLANYNHAQFLPTALAGIVGQTHAATEVLVVDDGSTDDSAAVIRDFAARYPHIRLLTNETNRGQHYSIQRALLEARGEYIVWAASDDLLLPSFLERSLRMLQAHPEAGLCFSRLSVFSDGTTEIRHYTGSTRDASFDYGAGARHFSPRQLEDALRHHYLWMSGNTVVAHRAALLEMGGFEPALRWHADWFAYYVVALRYGACVIPETLALMRERKGTYSGGGISDAVQQGQVLAAMLDLIRSPKYRDVLPIFRRRPSLLALFGKKVIYAALRNPRHWPTAWALIRWHGPRYLRAKYREFRNQPPRSPVS